MRDPLDLDERQTRRQLIDEELRLAGWDPTDTAQVVPELDVRMAGPSSIGDPVRSGESRGGLTDYALLVDGMPLAVIEAKRTARDAREGQEQARQYAEGLAALEDHRLPFVFYTNGHRHYFWDTERYPPVQIYGYPSRADIEWMDQRRRERKPLAAELIDSSIVDRDYQVAAVRSVLEALEASRTRFLLVMATGTGKTRTAIALAELLVRARWVKRVLFLVDRTALQEQALGDFKQFMPGTPRWPQGPDLLQDFVTDARIYVTTYQRMLNLIEDGREDGQRRISPFFFDLVVADESHRTVYNVYRQVLDYFPGLRLGLTATPKDRVDQNTFALFDCTDGVPTYGFSFEEAVEHEPPYLCDFEVLKERSKFQLEGIRGRLLPPDQRGQLLAEGHDLEDIDFEGSDLERKVTNSGTNVLIVRELMDECIKDPSGTLPGKSIVFAMSKDHAWRLQEIFDRLYPQYRGRLARVLVSGDARVHGKGGLLDQFKTRDMPRVAISVDMLDTGVDVREVVNLVFAKPVYSYVKFWQMIGRGTRLLPEPAQRRPWCLDKDRFLIFDVWGTFDYFGMHPAGREPGQGPEALPVRLFRRRLDRLEAAVALGNTKVSRLAVGHLRQDLSQLPSGNVVVLENRADLDKVRDDGFWHQLTAGAIGFLRTIIAPLLRVRAPVDAKALRFEMEIVELGTALLAADTEMRAALELSLRSQLSELPLTVNVVAEQRDLIVAAQHDDWWQISEDELEDRLDLLAARVAPLMGFRRLPRDGIVKLHLDDLVAFKERIDFGPGHASLPIEEYRQRAEARIRALVDENPVLARLREGQDVSEAEIQQIAEVLRSQDPYITEARLRRVYDHKTARFVQFLRHILGVEELPDRSESLRRAFDDLIVRHNWSGLQLRFLMTLRSFLIERGQVSRGILVSPPFTQFHPRGVRGVFAQPEIDELIGLLDGMGEWTA